MLWQDNTAVNIPAVDEFVSVELLNGISHLDRLLPGAIVQYYHISKSNRFVGCISSHGSGISYREGLKRGTDKEPLKSDTLSVGKSIRLYFSFPIGCVINGTRVRVFLRWGETDFDIG